MGGSADLFAQRLPLGEAIGVQKSKVLWNKLFRAFQWSAYLRPAVLGILGRYTKTTLLGN